MPRHLRKPVNLSIDPALGAKARDPGVTVSRAAEAGLRAAVAWRAKNSAAIQSSNECVRTHGLPL